MRKTKTKNICPDDIFSVHVLHQSLRELNFFLGYAPKIVHVSLRYVRADFSDEGQIQTKK